MEHTYPGCIVHDFPGTLSQAAVCAVQAPCRHTAPGYAINLAAAGGASPAAGYIGGAVPAAVDRLAPAGRGNLAGGDRAKLLTYTASVKHAALTGSRLPN
jgi:hypothetical protein